MEVPTTALPPKPWCFLGDVDESAKAKAKAKALLALADPRTRRASMESMALAWRPANNDAGEIPIATPPPPRGRTMSADSNLQYQSEGTKPVGVSATSSNIVSSTSDLINNTQDAPMDDQSNILGASVGVRARASRKPGNLPSVGPTPYCDELEKESALSNSNETNQGGSLIAALKANFDDEKKSPPQKATKTTTATTKVEKSRSSPAQSENGKGGVRSKASKYGDRSRESRASIGPGSSSQQQPSRRPSAQYGQPPNTKTEKTTSIRRRASFNAMSAMQSAAVRPRPRNDYVLTRSVSDLKLNFIGANTATAAAAATAADNNMKAAVDHLLVHKYDPKQNCEWSEKAAVDHLVVHKHDPKQNCEWSEKAVVEVHKHDPKQNCEWSAKVEELKSRFMPPSNNEKESLHVDSQCPEADAAVADAAENAERAWRSKVEELKAFFAQYASATRTAEPQSESHLKASQSGAECQQPDPETQQELDRRSKIEELRAIFIQFSSIASASREHQHQQQQEKDVPQPLLFEFQRTDMNAGTNHSANKSNNNNHKLLNPLELQQDVVGRSKIEELILNFVAPSGASNRNEVKAMPEFEFQRASGSKADPCTNKLDPRKQDHAAVVGIGRNKVEEMRSKFVPSSSSGARDVEEKDLQQFEFQRAGTNKTASAVAADMKTDPSKLDPKQDNVVVGIGRNKVEEMRSKFVPSSSSGARDDEEKYVQQHEFQRAGTNKTTSAVAADMKTNPNASTHDPKQHHVVAAVGRNKVEELRSKFVPSSSSDARDEEVKGLQQYDFQRAGTNKATSAVAADIKTGPGANKLGPQNQDHVVAVGRSKVEEMRSKFVPSASASDGMDLHRSEFNATRPPADSNKNKMSRIDPQSANTKQQPAPKPDRAWRNTSTPDADGLQWYYASTRACCDMDVELNAAAAAAAAAADMSRNDQNAAKKLHVPKPDGAWRSSSTTTTTANNNRNNNLQLYYASSASARDGMDLQQAEVSSTADMRAYASETKKKLASKPDGAWRNSSSATATSSNMNRMPSASYYPGATATTCEEMEELQVVESPTRVSDCPIPQEMETSDDFLNSSLSSLGSFAKLEPDDNNDNDINGNNQDDADQKSSMSITFDRKADNSMTSFDHKAMTEHVRGGTSSGKTKAASSKHNKHDDEDYSNDPTKAVLAKLSKEEKRRRARLYWQQSQSRLVSSCRDLSACHGSMTSCSVVPSKDPEPTKEDRGSKEKSKTKKKKEKSKKEENKDKKEKSHSRRPKLHSTKPPTAPIKSASCRDLGSSSSYQAPATHHGDLKDSASVGGGRSNVVMTEQQRKEERRRMAKLLWIKTKDSIPAIASSSSAATTTASAANSASTTATASTAATASTSSTVTTSLSSSSSCRDLSSFHNSHTSSASTNEDHPNNKAEEEEDGDDEQEEETVDPAKMTAQQRKAERRRRAKMLWQKAPVTQEEKITPMFYSCRNLGQQQQQHSFENSFTNSSDDHDLEPLPTTPGGSVLEKLSKEERRRRAKLSWQAAKPDP